MPALHAPAGGVSIHGIAFKGGQFVASELADSLTPEERAKAERGETVGHADKLRGVPWLRAHHQGVHIKTADGSETAWHGMFAVPHHIAATFSPEEQDAIRNGTAHGDVRPTTAAERRSQGLYDPGSWDADTYFDDEEAADRAGRTLDGLDHEDVNLDALDPGTREAVADDLLDASTDPDFFGTAVSNLARNAATSGDGPDFTKGAGKLLLELADRRQPPPPGQPDPLAPPPFDPANRDYQLYDVSTATPEARRVFAAMRPVWQSADGAYMVLDHDHGAPDADDMPKIGADADGELGDEGTLQKLFEKLPETRIRESDVPASARNFGRVSGSSRQPATKPTGPLPRFASGEAVGLDTLNAAARSAPYREDIRKLIDPAEQKQWDQDSQTMRRAIQAHPNDDDAAYKQFRAEREYLGEPKPDLGDWDSSAVDVYRPVNKHWMLLRRGTHSPEVLAGEPTYEMVARKSVPNTTGLPPEFWADLTAHDPGEVDEEKATAKEERNAGASETNGVKFGNVRKRVRSAKQKLKAFDRQYGKLRASHAELVGKHASAKAHEEAADDLYSQDEGYHDTGGVSPDYDAAAKRLAWTLADAANHTTPDEPEFSAQNVKELVSEETDTDNRSPEKRADELEGAVKSAGSRKYGYQPVAKQQRESHAEFDKHLAERRDKWRDLEHSARAVRALSKTQVAGLDQDDRRANFDAAGVILKKAKVMGRRLDRKAKKTPPAARG